MFKQHYTPEDIAEVKQWFEDHKESIPKTLQLNKATFCNDLPHAIQTILEVYKLNGDNPTFSGQYNQLFLIRERLEDLAKEK